MLRLLVTDPSEPISAEMIDARTRRRSAVASAAGVGVAAGSLAAYDRWVVRPALRVGIVDVVRSEHLPLGVSSGERKSFRDAKFYKRRKRWLA